MDNAKWATKLRFDYVVKTSISYFIPKPLYFAFAGFWRFTAIVYKCPFAEKCWLKLLRSFNINWIFDSDFKKNVFQLQISPNLKQKPKLLWTNRPTFKNFSENLVWAKSKNMKTKIPIEWLFWTLLESMPPHGAR